MNKLRLRSSNSPIILIYYNNKKINKIKTVQKRKVGRVHLQTVKKITTLNFLFVLVQ